MEEAFGKKEARQQSISTLINYAGRIIKGKTVLVPIRRETYAEHVDPMVEAASGDWSMAEFVTHKAVRGTPVTMQEAASYGELHDPSDPATRWARWPIQKIASLLTPSRQS
jgi:hypothetical protein